MAKLRKYKGTQIIFTKHPEKVSVNLAFYRYSNLNNTSRFLFYTFERNTLFHIAQLISLKKKLLNIKKNILIAPLNWGLGHATRCIPVIKALEQHSFNPIIASDGDSLSFLKKEFPNLTALEFTFLRYSLF